MAEKARREPHERAGESRGDRAVLAPGEREGGRDRGLPCAVVDDDGRARGGVHGWQLRRVVPAGSCLRRRRRRCRREAGHRGQPRSRRPRSLSLPRDARSSRAEAGRRAGGRRRGRQEGRADRLGIGWRAAAWGRGIRGGGAGGARRVAWRWGGDLHVTNSRLDLVDEGSGKEPASRSRTQASRRSGWVACGL